MFIPLHDRNTLKYIRVQYVTIGLIVLNTILWLITGPLFVSAQTADAAILSFGYIPAVAFGYAHLDPALVMVSPQASYVTYAFLHGDVWHLATNMLFLWVFGDNVEDALGHARFLMFYLLCAAAGALAHGLLATTSEGPLIGASGAISGVVAAYFLLHPRVRVWVLVLFRIPLPLPAFIPLAFWIGQQVFMLLVDPQGGISFAAHVGGIAAGLVLVIVLRRPGVPLFDRVVVTPKAVVTTTEPSVSQAPKGPWGGTS